MKLKHKKHNNRQCKITKWKGYSHCSIKLIALHVKKYDIGKQLKVHQLMMFLNVNSGS